MYIKKKESPIIAIVEIFGFLISIVASLFVAINSSDYYPIMFFIPLLFGFFTFIPGRLMRYLSPSPGIVYFLLLVSVRYFITPIVTSLSGDYSVFAGRYTNPDYLFLANIMLIYEMIVVYIVAHITLRNYSKSLKIEEEVIIYKESQFVLILFILFAIVLIVIKPSLIKEYNFVFAITSTQSNINEVENWGLFSIIVSTAKLLLPLTFLYYGKILYERRQKFIYVLIALVPSLVITMFVQGMRRGALLTPLVLILLLSVNIFPKYKKRIFLLMGGAAGIILTFMTLQKSILRQSANLESLQDQINWFSVYLDSYFAFIKHIAAAIETNIRYREAIGISSLLNDVLYPFPALGGMIFDGINRSAIYFNYTYHNTTLITDAVIPTIGQGIMYLGYLFSPMLAGVMIRLSLASDKKYRSSKDIIHKFLWGYIAWTLAASIDGNINQLFKTLFQVVLPAYLVYLVYRYFVLKKSIK